MKTAILRYRVIIRKDGKHYIADVPTLGISDFGRTIQEAKQHVHDAIACHVEGLLKTHTSIPSPDTDEFYISTSEVTFPQAISFAT